MISPTGRYRLLLFWLAALLVSQGVNRVQARTIDQNGNGISDIWELVYAANGLDPNGDADADGVPNGLEAIAGTDPFDSASVPKISLSAMVGTNFVVTIPGSLGKQYTL